MNRELFVYILTNNLLFSDKVLDPYVSTYFVL